MNSKNLLLKGQVRIGIFFFPILCMLIFSGPTKADVSFTNGFWSTTFEACSEGVTLSGYQCDGINIEDNYNISGTYSRIRTVANDASGKEGKVFTLYFEGNSRNSMSTPLAARFVVPQKEFWIRFYYRLPSGQQLGGITEHKIIYLYTNSNVAVNVNWPGQEDQISMTFHGSMGDSDIYFGSEGGWADTYGSFATPANGSWHFFEFHFDLGTSRSNNGKFDMWVDGIHRASKWNLDWFNGGSESPTGFTYMYIPLNHNVFRLSGANPHDVDNLAIALPSYNGFVNDSSGRRLIGPVGSQQPPPNSNVSVPTGLKIVE